MNTPIVDRPVGIARRNFLGAAGMAFGAASAFGAGLLTPLSALGTKPRRRLRRARPGR